MDKLFRPAERLSCERTHMTYTADPAASKYIPSDVLDHPTAFDEGTDAK
jgi:hypothetical protein